MAVEESRLRRVFHVLPMRVAHVRETFLFHILDSVFCGRNPW